MIRPWLAALLVAALGCASVQAVEPMHPRDEEDVVDAVLRALLVDVAPEPGEAICVVVRRTVDGKEQLGDPTAEHLARLQAADARMRAGSACTRRRGEPATETATGARAVVVDIGPVLLRGDDRAEAEAGFSRGGWATTSSAYQLVKRTGGWAIERVTRKTVT